MVITAMPLEPQLIRIGNGSDLSLLIHHACDIFGREQIATKAGIGESTIKKWSSDMHIPRNKQMHAFLSAMLEMPRDSDCYALGTGLAQYIETEPKRMELLLGTDECNAERHHRIMEFTILKRVGYHHINRMREMDWDNREPTFDVSETAVPDPRMVNGRTQLLNPFQYLGLERVRIKQIFVNQPFKAGKPRGTLTGRRSATSIWVR